MVLLAGKIEFLKKNLKFKIIFQIEKVGTMDLKKIENLEFLKKLNSGTLARKLFK